MDFSKKCKQSRLFNEAKTFLLLVFIFLVPGAMVAAAETSRPSEITLGFIPGESREELLKNGKELAVLLQESLGLSVNIYVSKDYQSLIDAMKDKKVDFAFFTAASFVEAEKVAGAKVLLKKVWDSPFYYSAILVKKSSSVNQISDLKGKAFSFVDAKSTSGYLYPMVHFQKLGLKSSDFFSKIFFKGNHQAAVESVIKGESVATAVFADDPKGIKNAWSKFFPHSKETPKILWVSEPIPNDPFCVRKDFYDKYPTVTHDIMFALIELKDNPKRGDLLKKLIGASELQLASSRQYEPVREMMRTFNLKLN